MSSRSIEGENPLYLPQAKSYDGCAALGPCIFVPETPISLETAIHLSIKRNGDEIFNGSAKLTQMKRRLMELTEWLTRECSFPTGVFLMTGTCLVPKNDFTLQPFDIISITIDGIGTLTNTVSPNWRLSDYFLPKILDKKPFLGVFSSSMAVRRCIKNALLLIISVSAPAFRASFFTVGESSAVM